MNIIFFAHPEFLGSQSMPRFTNMLVHGMKQRGCQVKLFRPRAVLSRVPGPRVMRKWLGYIDQYVLFPLSIRKSIKRCDRDTLFVFTDHALGPWVPMVADRAHVIHCHDFLAQRSAKNQIPENVTGWFGRQYQSLIHRGYSRGKHFISVSNKTREDLHAFLPARPLRSEVIYNGLNQNFKPLDPVIARAVLCEHTGLFLRHGYVLHVGGNQWYKNRVGVIEIYNAWRATQRKSLPLLMIGKRPDAKLRAAYALSPYQKDIYWIENLTDKLLPVAYSGANVFLFPSLAEGFGWPIAEAMACGCPVITTNAAPMTEVAGGAAFLISRRPGDKHGVYEWARRAALVLGEVVDLDQHERSRLIDDGLLNANRFDAELALDRIEKIYREVWSASRQKRSFYLFPEKANL